MQIGEVSKEVAESLGLKNAQGAEVSLVEPGGPADKAGIKSGDIILKFNGAPVTRSSDLPRLVGGTAINSKATVTVWRKGQQIDLPVVVAELEPEKGAKASKGKGKGGQAEPDAAGKPNALGLVVSDLSAEKKKSLGVSGGVVVESAEGVAARLQEGDVVLQLNNSEVKDAKQFNALVAKLDPKKPSVLLVRRGEATQFISLRPSAAAK